MTRRDPDRARDSTPRLQRALRAARTGHEAARSALEAQERGSEGVDPARGVETAAPARAWLRPILVDYFSRDGSTFLMRLLATSAHVAVEPPYPYERKYFAYLYRWARLLDRTEWDQERWNAANLGSLAQESHDALVGPPPWFPRRSFDGTPGEAALSRRCFDLAWSEFSARATRLTQELHGSEAGPVRFYAEKHLRTRQIDLGELPPVELIVLLRDPRDTYLSIEAFNAKRGEGTRPIGRVPGESDERFRARFIATQRDRLQWVARLGTQASLVVRYDDLVTNTAAVAKLLNERLAIDVDHEAAWADTAMRLEHATAASPAASVGRWRAELTAEQKRRFERELGGELDALGFSLS